MNVTPEMLMAYADGELDAISAKRVEKAVAADPALAASIAAHRDLRDRISQDFAPIATAPLPDALVRMVRDGAKVTPIGKTRRRLPVPGGVRIGLAAAAALAIGIAMGPLLSTTNSDIATRDGMVIAQGKLAHALDTQLASTQADSGMRMLVSFREQNGRYCRVFEQQRTGGIACRGAAGWNVRQLRTTAPTEQTQYRQAGSQAGALMAAAQDMMAGNPLDAQQESAARAAHWKVQ